jgi:poly(3-hydroxybutyrate) depolymerase
MTRVASVPSPGCLLLLLALLAVGAARAADRLPGLDADLSATSVSGISSGGYMAVQFHVAHSATVVGAGVLAAGPYYCAQGSAWTAIYNCMKPGIWTPLPRVSLLKVDTDILAGSGLIDPTANLRRARVWLFTGKRDDTVHASVVEALERYYREYVPPAAIAYVKVVNAGHAMVTTDYGGSCASTAAPFINDCNYDAAGKLLEHIYGALNPPAAQGTGRLVTFDQSEFAGGPAYAVSLAATGYVYVPRGCESAHCRVHVVFHGCQQNAEAVGEQFTHHAGYNRWADTNGIIVLYPQTIARYGFGGWPVSFVYNPNGCWDWWGYTGADYHMKSGAQIRAVKAMLDRLAQHR